MAEAMENSEDIKEKVNGRIKFTNVLEIEGVTLKISKTFTNTAENPECAVCLQPCVHPAQLPCGHIFCYLCVKGFANQNKRCAMCRQEIPRDFVDQPHLLNIPTPLDNGQSFDDGFQWFYEGRNGWWKYDSRASEEIEEAYKLQLAQFDLIICGDLYVIDFQNKYQYPKNHPSRKRAIRRDVVNNLVVKGVAGLK